MLSYIFYIPNIMNIAFVKKNTSAKYVYFLLACQNMERNVLLFHRVTEVIQRLRQIMYLGRYNRNSLLNLKVLGVYIL